MAKVGIRDLQRDASAIVGRVARTGKATLVTNRGEPVAAIVPVDRDDWEDYVLANAPSFLLSMERADRDLAAGDIRDSEDVFAELGVEAPPPEPKTPAEPRLSDRERDVLLLLAQGCSNAEIAKRLHIAPQTVRRTLGSTFRKLGVSERSAGASPRRRAPSAKRR
jgi:prevent-host-death family protein